MWVRNGSVMSDQVLNYAEAPYSKIYRELDVLLVQFMFSVAYCDAQSPSSPHTTSNDDKDEDTADSDLSTRRTTCSTRMTVASYLTCLLMYRFDVSEYLSFRRVAATGLSASLNRTTLPQLVDELLKFIINLATELPIAPDNATAIDLSPSSSSSSSSSTTTSPVIVSPRIRTLVRRELIQKLAGGTYINTLHQYVHKHPSSVRA